MINRSVVIKRNKLKFPKFDYKSIILLTLFICGIIIGSVTVIKGDNEFKEIIKSFTENYIKSRNELNFLRLFGSTVIEYTVFPLICFLFGLCAVGLPVIYLIPLVYGLISSIIVTFFVSTYSTNGLGFSAIIIPAVSLTAGVLIKCCSTASDMSFNILTAVSGSEGKKGNNNDLIKDYVARYTVYLIPVILSALIMCASFRIFGNLFNII